MAAGLSCEDGNLCNGDERCDAMGSCVTGTPLALDDHDPCTWDVCDPMQGVEHTEIPGCRCDNATFGVDPIPGPFKACYFAQTDYPFAVIEGSHIGQLTNQPVAFGGNGKFFYTIANGDFDCSRAVFGDPAVNVLKSCYFLTNEGYVADEYQNYSVPLLVQTPNPIIDITYGSGANGNFLSRGFQPQTGTCGNALAGGDPDVGAIKHCWGSQAFTL